MNGQEKEDAITLEILQTIENKSDVSQRFLADNMGVALGLANSYLKRCVRKGYIKIQQIPANRYLYYLTPQGFAEKSRLTAEYLTSSFDFYRKASESINHSLNECHERGYQKVVFCGISELAEIASIRLHEYELEHLATIEKNTSLQKYLGRPMHSVPSVQDENAAYLITNLVNSQDVYNDITEKFGKEKVFVPGILGLKI